MYTDRMNLLQRGANLLADTEGALRALIEEGLSRQNYREISELAQVAEQIAAIRITIAGGDNQESALPERYALQSAEDPVVRAATVSHTFAKPKTQIKTSQQPAVRSKGTEPEGLRIYPIFERDGDKLVKIGWSERDERRYEHRAPQSVVMRACNVIARHGRSGQQFKMDAVVKELAADSEPIPSYQAYLALAWLRSAGAIDRDGKEGYRTKNGPLTAERLTELWHGLTPRA